MVLVPLTLLVDIDLNQAIDVLLLLFYVLWNVYKWYIDFAADDILLSVPNDLAPAILVTIYLHVSIDLIEYSFQAHCRDG